MDESGKAVNHGVRTVFIVEGTKREKKYLRRVLEVFFPAEKDNFEILALGSNLYMLWDAMDKDGFRTDVIDMIAKEFPDAMKGHENLTQDNAMPIYLFFDYDPHHSNLPGGVSTEEALARMLERFSNATEFGKLYVSYPMVEAARDWVQGTCNVHTGCVLSNNDANSYKESSGQNNDNRFVNSYDESRWNGEIENFAMRIGCLFDLKKVPDYSFFYDSVTPQTIFDRQKPYMAKREFFVLSYIPEFLIDYFHEPFWVERVRASELAPDKSRCLKP